MSTATYFDQHHKQMTAGRDGCWSFAYRQQVWLLESLIRPGMTVLDVGCGPNLPYHAPYAYIVGLDPSAESLAQNTDVDDRIVGSAECIPLPSRSVDLAVAFYALHHMTGKTARETYLIRSMALYEMRRVLKPGGELLVFEMSPWPLATLAQRLLWPMAKRLLGHRLDAYFWASDDFEQAQPFEPMTAQTFGVSPFTTFPPILSLPWLRIPRFAYPLTPTLFRWRV